MDKNEIIDIINGMCERCLIKGIISTLDDAKTLYDVFDRFRKNNYINDEEYSSDILYLYNLAVKLHESRNTSLEESYSIYNAILNADRIDFIETDKTVDVVEPVILEKTKRECVKNKRSKKIKEDIDVIDISDIVIDENIL